MKNPYIVYKVVEDRESGKPVFLYIEKKKGIHFSYTEKTVRAKRYFLISAFLVSLIFGLSFVRYRLVKMYN